MRSYQYYSESIVKRHGFVGYPCTDKESFEDVSVSRVLRSPTNRIGVASVVRGGTRESSRGGCVSHLKNDSGLSNRTRDRGRGVEKLGREMGLIALS